MSGVSYDPACVDTEDPSHWSNALGASYSGDECSNCGRQRVLFYEEVDRSICEKCNWDQHQGDYAEDHRIIG